VLAIITSERAVSLRKVANDIARAAKAYVPKAVLEDIVFFYGLTDEVLDLRPNDRAVVVMPFDPSPAITYFWVAWELQKTVKRLVFYTTIEGRVYQPSVPQWIYRDLKFVANSEYVAGKLREAGASIEAIVPHGVDLEAVDEARFYALRFRDELGLGEENFVAGYVAGCYPRKGHDLFSVVVRHVQTLDPTIKFVILTAEACAKYYEDLENAVPLTDFGKLPEQAVYSLYHSLDVYVQPALIEGFGLPVLEALAAGKLVVHPDYKPLSEITTPETSIKVPVVDVKYVREGGSIEYELHRYDPKEFANAIVKAKGLVLQKKEELARLCRARAERFKLPQVYKPLIAMLYPVKRGG